MAGLLENGNLIQTASIVVAILTFVVAHFIARGRDRQVANRETYQRLELASIDLFRFEADHRELIRPIWEDGESLPDPGTADRVAVTNYVCQVLNLFEMAVRLRREGVVPPEVFGSWVLWYLELAGAPGFPPIWAEVKWQYTSELRGIMTAGVEVHRQAAAEGERRHRFFEQVGATLGCKAITRLLAAMEEDEQQCAAAVAPKPVTRSASDLAIAWHDASAEGFDFADFFLENVDPSYISHGELQDGRALDRRTWSPRLREILEEEVRAAGSRVAIARAGSAVMAAMLVEIVARPQGRHAVLQDMIVARAARGQGIGAALLVWLEDELRTQGIERLYLESSGENAAALRFFASRGFDPVSVVMLRELTSRP